MNLKQYMKQRNRDKTSENNKIVELYVSKLKRLRHVRINKSLLIAASALLISAAVIIGIQRHVYHEYQVISSAQNEDTQSAGYAQLGGCLLKYGDDGMYLLSQSEKVLWNQTFEMSNPDSDIRGEYGVIYDKKGTSMYVLNREKPIGPVETKFPILKARVTEKGTVAAILEDGEKTWINYYASDGSTIAENQTRMENPGYPLDIAAAPNGETIAVSYLFVENGQVSSRIVYYNFGDEGQNKVDNIVADFTYEGIIVPQIIYLNNNTSIALREDGFSVFEGEGVPEEKLNKKIEEEIISTFYNEKYFGLVLKGKDEKEQYVMQLYEPSGRKRFSEGFDKEYHDIHISQDKIIMINDAEVMMYNLKGILKFQGIMEEGAVKNLFQVTSKHYMMISENGINTIKLK